jgi:hypothetical protein
LSSVFPESPLTAFKRQDNLRGIMIRWKVPEPPSKKNWTKYQWYEEVWESLHGIPLHTQGKSSQNWWIKNMVSEETTIMWKLQYNLHDTVYQRTLKGTLVYRGFWETPQVPPCRFWSYVTNGVTKQATGFHFNTIGHSLSQMKITILEQVKICSSEYKKEREQYNINKFNTCYQGMNRQMWRRGLREVFEYHYTFCLTS